MPSLRNHYINAFASFLCSPKLVIRSLILLHTFIIYAQFSGSMPPADLIRELGQMSVCIIAASGFFADAPNEVSDLCVGASSKLTRPSRSECGRHSFGRA